MALLLDTQILVWIGLDDRRLPAWFRDELSNPDASFAVSAIIAYEFEDLRIRQRLGDVDTVGVLIAGLNAMLLDYPAQAYRMVPLLPKLHKDPVDRMLIAHAIHADLTIVTSDATIREYPVRTRW